MTSPLMLAKVAYDEHYGDLGKMMDDLGKLLRHNFKLLRGYLPRAGAFRQRHATPMRSVRAWTLK